jgi:thiamine pyrophosphokinase
VSETVVVFAAGAAAVDQFPEGATVIAADGGAEHALALGVRVDVAIGDFDSLSPEMVAQLEASGTRIERYPPAKDATDLELALEAAVGLGPERVLVIGGVDGRLDHLLGILLLLGAEAYTGVEIDARLGDATVHVVRGRRVLRGRPGETISIFALHGPANGVRTRGFVYPLSGETLPSGSSLGCSNVFADFEASIELTDGVLLAVRPGSAEAGSAS